MRNKDISLDFFKRSLVLNNDENTCKEKSLCSLDLESSGLSEVQKEEFKEFLVDFGDVFSDKPGLTQVAWHEINNGSAAPVASKPYRYDKLKQSIRHFDRWQRVT